MREWMCKLSYLWSTAFSVCNKRTYLSCYMFCLLFCDSFIEHRSRMYSTRVSGMKICWYCSVMYLPFPSVFQFKGSTPSACWNKIYKRIRKTQNTSLVGSNANADSGLEGTYKSGSHMFGFSIPEVAKLIQVPKLSCALDLLGFFYCYTFVDTAMYFHVFLGYDVNFIYLFSQILILCFMVVLLNLLSRLIHHLTNIWITFLNLLIIFGVNIYNHGHELLNGFT